MGPSQEQASPTPTPIIPQTGAAPYWYVDPHATGISATITSNPFDPMNFLDEQGHTEEELKQLEAALSRIGVIPQGQQPSF